MKLKKNFNCTIKMLYSICTMCWNSCSEYLTDFTKFKPFYDAKFVSDALQAIKDAQNLTSTSTAIVTRKVARKNLLAAAITVRSNWQNLKVYITNAYTKDIAPAMLEEAGARYFKKSSGNQWSSLTALINSSVKFLSDHGDELSKDKNMPDSFPLDFLAAADNFTELAAIFFVADKDKKVIVENKMEANNNIYESTITMLKDGQQIFKDNEAVKAMFVFAQQVGIQEGTGSASLVGYIKNDSRLPIAGATVSSSEMGYGAITNSKGYFKISRMVAGNYTITITCPGYVSQTLDVKLTAGTRSKANLTLASALKKQAAA